MCVSEKYLEPCHWFKQIQEPSGKHLLNILLKALLILDCMSCSSEIYPVHLAGTVQLSQVVA